MSEYDSITHCSSVAVAARLFCIAGSATLTTVPSMNAMLEPRMVVTRIHRPTSRAHGAETGRERMTPSSQGALPIAIIRFLRDAGAAGQLSCRVPRQGTATSSKKHVAHLKLK